MGKKPSTATIKKAVGLIFGPPRCGACGAMSRRPHPHRKIQKCENGHTFTYKRS